MKKFIKELIDFLYIYFNFEEPYKRQTKTQREKFAAEIGRCVTFGKISGRLEISNADNNLCLMIVDSKGMRYKLHGFIPGAALNREVAAETNTDIDSSLKITFFLR